MSLRWIITYNRNARKIALIHHYRGSHFLYFSHLWEKRRETLFQWRVSFLYTVRYFGIAKLAKSCYCSGRDRLPCTFLWVMVVRHEFAVCIHFRSLASSDSSMELASNICNYLHLEHNMLPQQRWGCNWQKLHTHFGLMNGTNPFRNSAVA